MWRIINQRYTGPQYGGLAEGVAMTTGPAASHLQDNSLLGIGAGAPTTWRPQSPRTNCSTAPENLGVSTEWGYQ